MLISRPTINADGGLSGNDTPYMETQSISERVSGP
jgi:hypothetical protein